MKHIKWYHWFLYPFAKKLKGCDDNYCVYSFIFNGHIYVYKMTEEPQQEVIYEPQGS